MLGFSEPNRVDYGWSVTSAWLETFNGEFGFGFSMVGFGFWWETFGGEFGFGFWIVGFGFSSSGAGGRDIGMSMSIGPRFAL